MKGPHPYSVRCQCYRCKGVRGLMAKYVTGRTKTPPRLQIKHAATREEQHARLIDCGPQNWDDKD